MVIELTQTNFESEINSTEPVLVDFYADWCSPCQNLMPIMDKLSEKYKVCKCNIEECGDIANQYHIMGVPTVLVFIDGIVVDRLNGVKTLFEYENAMRR